MSYLLKWQSPLSLTIYCVGRIWKNRHFHTPWVKVQNIQGLKRGIWQCWAKLHLHSAFHIAIPLLRIYLKITLAKMKKKMDKTIHVAKVQKQPQWPWIGDWFNKLWHIHTIEHHTIIAVRKDEELIYRLLWNYLWNTLSEKVQKKGV